MDHLVNPADERTTWTYDDAGQVTTLQLANDTKATSTYDDDGRLTRLANVKSDDSVISTFDYDLDAVGNRQAVVEADGTRVTWTYDKTYQLTRERRSGASSYDVTYTYDNAGNRTLKEDTGALTTSTYDAANQLLTSEDSSGVTSYTYDEAGNQTVEQTPNGNPTQNFWDGQNRLAHIILPDATFKAFDYNGDNLRVGKRIITTTGWKDFILPDWDNFALADWDTFPLDSTNSSETKIIWDGQNVLAETNAADTTQALYTLNPLGFGNLLSQRRSTTSSFFHFDGLGSTDRLTSSAEAVTDSYLYQAFGNLFSSSGATTNPFRFVGQPGYYYDSALSQYYVRARHYNPATARWLSADPIGLAGGPNLFAYVQNDPLQMIDASGLITPFAVFLIVGNALGCGIGTTWAVYAQATRAGAPPLGVNATTICSVISGCTWGVCSFSGAVLAAFELSLAGPAIVFGFGAVALACGWMKEFYCENCHAFCAALGIPGAGARVLPTPPPFIPPWWVPWPPVVPTLSPIPAVQFDQLLSPIC